MTFLDEIEAFLKLTSMSPTRFGKAVCNSPTFVDEVRGGRSCGKMVKARTREYMAANQHLRIIPIVSQEEKLRRSVKPNQHVVRHRPLIFVDRDPCGFCGIRRDIGCNHYEKSEPVRIG